MERYSIIDKGMKREFILLQGRGCRWRRCTFCDYHEDVSSSPAEVNREVLSRVTGIYGVLDIINSGSAMELDGETISMIRETAERKAIHTLWFEAHWMYHDRLDAFRQNFPGITVKFRIGAESFDIPLRESWRKGIGDISPERIREYFDGVCLLAGIKGQSAEGIMNDARIADSLFEYYSVNLFCPNSTDTERDDELAAVFISKLAPEIRKSPKAEVLIENTDLGVG